jgi:hypothetical protein
MEVQTERTTPTADDRLRLAMRVSVARIADLSGNSVACFAASPGRVQADPGGTIITGQLINLGPLPMGLSGAGLRDVGRTKPRQASTFRRVGNRAAGPAKHALQPKPSTTIALSSWN